MNEMFPVTGAAAAASPQKRKRKKGRIAGAVLLLFLIWLAVNFYLSNYVPETTYVDVTLDRLPSSFDGFRIAHLSDWHGEPFGPDNRDLIDRVRREAPDIIALTGDFLDSQEDLPDVRAFCAALTDIAPTYYVTGNHEWACGAQPYLKELFEDTGVVYLKNAFVDLTVNKESVCLVGIEDPNGPRDMPTPYQVMDNARGGRDICTILLAHRYDRLDTYAAAGADLVLSGHAHGGMIRLPFTDGLIGPGRRWLPQNTSGVVHKGDTTMVVSRGLGRGISEFTLAFRLFNQPELVIVTLKTG